VGLFNAMSNFYSNLKNDEVDNMAKVISVCPECGTNMIPENGCCICPECGWSPCHV
jgi:hypothetical protein